jgi:aryl-alcohol dehydrogenase-like predicted oxidoreductase
VSERVALGTAQFGMRYGVANRTGQVPFDEAAAIVAYARDCGIDTIDTAMAYGDSEACLGRIGVATWRVISKLPGLAPDCRDVESEIERVVAASLERLALPRVHALLLHRPGQLLGELGARIFESLERLKARGLTEKIGVSIYEPRELDALCAGFRFDVVQAPFSVVDRRLAESGWLARLRAQGIEVHARSAFLQGLLLMQPQERPEYFSPWAALWEQWERWLATRGVSAVQACLGFVLAHEEIDRVVVGVDRLEQLREVVRSAHADALVAPQSLSCTSIDLIDPSRWPQA